MGRIIGSARARLAFFGGVAVLLLGAIVLVPLQIVKVKMLPFDNKSEFQVMVDCRKAPRSKRPRGSPPRWLRA